jgi:hypothetical protein
MIGSNYRRSCERLWAAAGAISLLVVLATPSVSTAQTTESAKQRLKLPDGLTLAAISQVSSHSGVSPARQPSVSGRQERSVGRIILGAAVGATGGFFAGGYIGAKIDGDCGGCDDPGFKGALIGAPIGAVVGGILGGKFLF